MPGKISNWKEIPAMPAAGFKELILRSFPAKRVVKIFKTSGTTAERRAPSTTKASADVSSRFSRGTHWFDTMKLYEASILPPFRKYLFPDGNAEKLDYFFLMNSPKDAPESSLSHMMGLVNRSFAKGRGCFYFKKGEPRYETLLKNLSASKRKAILLSTAFSLKGFLEFLKAQKVTLKLAPGSRLMETGGFKGRTKEISKKKLIGECTQRLGIPASHCVSEYGMTELSSQFYDTTLWSQYQKTKQKLCKAGPAWIRAVVIDPRSGREATPGRRGLLRFFDLANRGSVMAVQTEDMGRRVGAGFELLGRAKGSEIRGCSLNYEEFLAG